MSSVVLYRTPEGKLSGMDDKAVRHFAKFKRAVDAMEAGDTLRFEYRLPRSPKHHRLFFVKVRELFDRQETFGHVDDLRAWLTVGAGYCHFIPGTDGQLVAIPESVSWESLEEADFLELHRRVDAFMWELRARRTLWPHLGDERTYWAVDAWRQEFEKP
ncbi:DUF1367 family protein [Variovorax boronicumulans]|uniref:DUF1367 family protein n=1 Tax=Variovorax boronicumulans TaxID=436515 RepID=UPI0012E5B4B2|nr:DUF1367 family protein [Variovorax boronicumulans]GER16705.1 hypothetical protein VCH24_17120 [Variovorax boronicumulans]